MVISWSSSVAATILATGFLSASSASSHADGVYVEDSLTTFEIPIQSVRELAFFHTTRQQYDYSCGSAAVSTLLTYHYDMPTSEADIFKAMFAAGDKAKIRREGFSLLDMKLYLEARGLKVDGFKVSLDELREIGVPAILLINDDNYNHFVVAKGIRDTEVMLGDPAKGIRYVPRGQFDNIWNGIAFLIESEPDIGSRNFNLSSEWAAIPRAPIAQMINRDGLESITLFLRRPSEF